MITGLHSGTHSYIVIISGILVIAIADGLSDTLGIHISEEAENEHTTREIWESAISTFISKFIFAVMFIIPLVMLPLSIAISVCIVLGLALISLLSFVMAKKQHTKSYKVVLEHLTIAIVVIIATHYIGSWAAALA